MTHRGRGCLELKPSSNPFFQTENTSIGVKAEGEIDWKIQGKSPKFHASSHSVDGNFAFLYTRTSDDIGGKVPKTQPSSATRLLTKTEFLRAKREEIHAEKAADGVKSLDDDYHIDMRKPTADDILQVYKHSPKIEDARYTTSMNDYGKKAPSAATVVVDRLARPQGFSKSFQNVKPQNTGLNTGLSKSTVHKTLDPQFA